MSVCGYTPAVCVLTIFLSPDVLPNHVPQVLINKETLPHVKGFDVQLLGLCDDIATELCRLLGTDWLEDIGITTPVECECVCVCVCVCV